MQEAFGIFYALELWGGGGNGGIKERAQHPTSSPSPGWQGANEPWPQFLPIARDQRVAGLKAAWTCAGQPWPTAATCPAAGTSCT